MNKIMNPPRITYPTNEEFAAICRVDNTIANNSIMVFIRPATEKEVDELSEGNSIKIHHNDNDIFIDESMCYAFGNVDLNNNEDIDLIKSFKWTTNRYAGFAIPRDYNYDDNTGDSFLCLTDRTYKPATIETFDNIKMFKFAYAKIGKPKNVIIYGIKSKLKAKIEYA